MGIETGGWGRRGPEFTRRNPEDPFGRGIESPGRHGIETSVEMESRSWLLDIIDPAKIERLGKMPAFEGHSTEWVIMQALLAKLVEQGPELSPTIRNRLRNLVGTLRMAFYPNMNQTEQQFVQNLVTQTTTVDFSKLPFEITPDTREDVTWIWQTFRLENPIYGDLPTRKSRLESSK